MMIYSDGSGTRQSGSCILPDFRNQPTKQLRTRGLAERLGGYAMALLRHRKLVCFYCGCRSAKVQDGSVRQWECTQCEAVNHLDEVK